MWKQGKEEAGEPWHGSVARVLVVPSRILRQMRGVRGACVAAVQRGRMCTTTRTDGGTRRCLKAWQWQDPPAAGPTGMEESEVEEEGASVFVRQRARAPGLMKLHAYLRNERMARAEEGLGLCARRRGAARARRGEIVVGQPVFADACRRTASHAAATAQVGDAVAREDAA